MAYSKRVKKIRDDFVALYDRAHAAYENGDRKSYLKLQKEFLAYCCKFQKELKISDRQIEGMRARLLEAEASEAHLLHLRAERKRLEREVEAAEKELLDDLPEADRRGFIKWN